MSQDELDPLVLEHMMGFNGDGKGSVQFHPVDKTVMISYTGCLLVIADVTSPHEQEFLRGHNEAITCLAISPSGNYIASGQASTTRVPNSEATVIVWDYKTRQPQYRLMELHDGIQFSRNKVCQLAFSPDDMFLAGSDDQCSGAKMCVWHTDNAQLATLTKTNDPLNFLCWGDILQPPSKTQRPAYHLLGATRSQINRYLISFDRSREAYKVDHTSMQLPSTGLARTYNTASVTWPSEQREKAYLVAGSAAGELCVFSVGDLVFRAAVPVSKGGLLALAMAPAQRGQPPKAYCGCGDGTLKLLQGADLQWVCLRETRLEGSIRSLTLSADGTELLAGTGTGNIYRLDAATLDNLGSAGQRAAKPLLAAHAKPISCVAFGQQSSEWFMTSSRSGTVRRWELSGYSVDYEISAPVKTTDAAAVVSAECMAVRKESVYSGWTDGFIRVYDEYNGAFLWEIMAHRGGTTCVDLTPLYLVSAGADGCLRVWSDQPSHQHVGNFDEHSKKRVTGMCVDLFKPSLIHTCSDNKTIVTVDLEQARRVTAHSVKDGALKAMTQLSTGEGELVTGDAAGNLKWWDCDEAEPVHMTMTWSPHDANKERRITHLDLRTGSRYMSACTATGDVQVWDLKNAQLASVGAAHSEEATMARWSPDGKQLISVGNDACICVWNFYDPEEEPASS